MDEHERAPGASVSGGRGLAYGISTEGAKAWCRATERPPHPVMFSVSGPGMGVCGRPGLTYMGKQNYVKLFGVK